MTANASSAVVDFGAIEEGGGGTSFRVPEGDYKFKVAKVEYATSAAGNPMFIWTFKGVDGKVKGKELKEYTALTPKALFKLRDLLTALAGKAPGGKVNTKKLLDVCKKLVGEELGITLADEEYTNDKGKTFISSKGQDFVSLDELSDEDPDDVEDEDDDDVEDEDDDSDETDAEDDPLADLDRAGLKAHIKANKLDIKVTKSMTDDAIREAIAAAGEDDDDEEEEIEDVDLDDL